MRNMSFMLTPEQIKNQTKTVTRRLGWKTLKPGTIVRAVRKCQGLKKGEHVEELALIRITDVREDRLLNLLAVFVHRLLLQFASPVRTDVERDAHRVRVRRMNNIPKLLLWANRV